MASLSITLLPLGRSIKGGVSICVCTCSIPELQYFPPIWATPSLFYPALLLQCPSFIFSKADASCILSSTVTFIHCSHTGGGLSLTLFPSPATLTTLSLPQQLCEMLGVDGSWQCLYWFGYFHCMLLRTPKRMRDGGVWERWNRGVDRRDGWAVVSEWGKELQSVNLYTYMVKV